MKKTALILIILTIGSKILGFTRDLVLSYFYGASDISDAYLIALTIPLSIFAFIGNGLATSYIPVYNDVIKKKEPRSVYRFTSNVINFILLMCALISIAVLIFTAPVVKLFASGFTGQTLQLAIKFTRISILGIFFSSLIYIFNSYLHLQNKFFLPALMGIPFNLFMIVSIYLSVKYNIALLSIGSVGALAIQFILMIPFIYKLGYRHHAILDKGDEDLRKMMFLSLPIIIGVSVNQINLLVDRTIASRILEGGVSILTYAERLNLFIQGIFVMSLATIVYPVISKLASEGNMDGLKKRLSETIRSINLLIIPSTVGIMNFSEPIVGVLFGRGAFDNQGISMTAYALSLYSIGMIGFGLREILSRTFYSLKDTKTPMINAAIAVGINILLNIVLSRFLGIGGLALATSISAIFCTFLLFISLRRKIGPLGMKRVIESTGKILVSSFTMGALAKLVYRVLISRYSLALSLGVSIIIGALTYFVMIFVMKVEEVQIIIDKLKGKLGKVSE